jgi:hypothetical protein
VPCNALLKFGAQTPHSSLSALVWCSLLACMTKLAIKLGA